MSKTTQILEITPPTELHFQGPFTQVVSSELTLNNPSDKHVCFKIKTTAPKRYCVRPNSGILQAKQRIAVQVMLQPFDFDPNEKNKHKFMVQSIVVASSTADPETVWKNANPSDLMDTKLKCVFDWPAAASPVQSESSSSPAQSSFSDSKSEQSASNETVKALSETVTKLRNENEKLKAGMWQGQVEQSSSSSFGVTTIAFIVIALIMGVILGKLVL
ncbi:Vesicle-associated membrane protein-associated protein B [Holothuria leucospilota]|uniref:Vesicle-associated membrane protein-associated protein B n=1 Tax=Holothuria leucospilota TaxID=206669 RepID=A0A9Q1CAG9_HOLLE|nr:Vesicle-associated membrane protein-associated protein B [Holothuria leucospilota]